MRLILSSEAAPDLPVPELAKAAASRGFAGLELVVDAAYDNPVAALPVVAIRVATMANVCSPGIVAMATRLGAAVVAPVVEVPPGAVKVYRAAGVRLLLAHGSDPDEVDRLRTLAGQAPDVFGLAWEADPADGNLAAGARTVLAAAGPALELVRMRGGGPEAATQSGQGVGVMMGRLALARYNGPLVIAPSTPRFQRAWSMWLGRTHGWGCGSKVADHELVVL